MSVMDDKRQNDEMTEREKCYNDVFTKWHNDIIGKTTQFQTDAIIKWLDDTTIEIVK